jgi:hypothetical protein
MTQFIFTRRDIQSRIGRLASVLSNEQVVGLIKRLNTPDRNRLPTMWEVVVLEALSFEGQLRHEACLPNGKRPDIDLVHYAPSGNSIHIVGDILTVSDAGLHEKNPIDVLFEMGPKLARKHGLNQSSLSFNVEGARQGEYGDGRMQLGLPNRGKLLQLLYGEVSAWLREVKTRPSEPSQFRPANAGIKLTITYDPHAKTRSGSYLSYDVAASLEKNPLYTALRDKKDQLRAAPSGAIKLLIACDGGSALISSRRIFRAPGTYDAIQVVDHFLEKHSGIDAVLLISIEEKHSVFPASTFRKLRLELRVSAALRGQPISPDCRTLDALLNRVGSRLPKPRFSAYNVAKWCLSPNGGPSLLGSNRITYEGSTRMKIEVSVKTLMALLAGKISVERFQEACRWGHQGGPKNPFAAGLEEGRMISDVGIESMEEAADDDWIVFELGNVDAAIAPFFFPNS